MTYYEKYSKANSPWDLYSMMQYDVKVIYMFAKPFESVTDQIQEIRDIADRVCAEKGWARDELFRDTV